MDTSQKQSCIIYGGPDHETRLNRAKQLSRDTGYVLVEKKDVLERYLGWTIKTTSKLFEANKDKTLILCDAYQDEEPSSDYDHLVTRSAIQEMIRTIVHYLGGTFKFYRTEDSPKRSSPADDLPVEDLRSFTKPQEYHIIVLVDKLDRLDPGILNNIQEKINLD